MGLALLIAGAITAMAAPPTTPPFTECPAIGSDSSCAILIIIGSGGSLSVVADSSKGPYDGVEDTLVGVVNNSGSTQNSITLSGVGVMGIPIFGFDGDGICTFAPFTGSSYCSSSAPTGYEGPNTSFSGISTDTKTGTVNFTGGLANGATAYFSLEDQITASTPIVPPPTTTPAPSALLLLATGLVGLAAWQVGRRFVRRTA